MLVHSSVDVYYIDIYASWYACAKRKRQKLPKKSLNLLSSC